MGGLVGEVGSPRSQRATAVQRQHACQGIDRMVHAIHIVDDEALKDKIAAQHRDAQYQAWADREEGLPLDVLRWVWRWTHWRDGRYKAGR